MGASLSQSCTPCLDGAPQEPDVPEINWKLLSWHACHKAVQEVMLRSRARGLYDHDSTFCFLLCHEAGVAGTSRAAQFASPFTATWTDDAEFSPAHVHVPHFMALLIDDLLPRHRLIASRCQ